jgi:hypothetical protein
LYKPTLSGLKFVYLCRVKKSGFILGLLILALYSCRNDLKLNAPYKEIPLVYAVLSPQEAEHKIRVNKIFLGEGDANIMAKVADSVNYKEGEISVVLERFDYWNRDLQLDAGLNTRTIVFTERVVNTLEGAFNSSQRIYVNSDKLYTNGVYKLTIKNNHTGNVFSSKAISFDTLTRLTGTGYWAASLLNPPMYPFPPNTPPDQYIDYSTGSSPIQKKVNYYPADTNVKICQQLIRLHFYDSLVTGEKSYRYVDFMGINQYPKDAATVAGNKMLIRSFTPAEIFSAVGIGLSKMNLPDVIGRKMYKVEYIIYGSTQEFSDYLQYSAPSLNIAQQKPLYSNFENSAALGIFTFRSRFSVSKSLHNYFVNEFSRNANTCKYKFFESDFRSGGWCP